jgi:hypothetical protein
VAQRQLVRKYCFFCCARARSVRRSVIGRTEQTPRSSRLFQHGFEVAERLSRGRQFRHTGPRLRHGYPWRATPGLPRIACGPDGA